MLLEQFDGRDLAGWIDQPCSNRIPCKFSRFWKYGITFNLYNLSTLEYSETKQETK